jgi:hypothetical protein
MYEINNYFCVDFVSMYDVKYARNKKGFIVHPLKKYLSNLLIASASTAEYEQQVELLARRISLSPGRLERLHYTTQVKPSPETALRLELATNGQVPADSVCDPGPLIELVMKVLEMRANNKQG